MPVVIPAAPNSTSSLQTVPTQTVFDYLYDTQNNPLKVKRVVVTLSVENANAITPQVSLANVVVQTTTDQNGYWSVKLIPNANINPANTVYTVQVEQGLPDYQISIPSSGGPFQSTSPSVLVNTPGVLQPATSGITGNLTVTGNESVTGTLGVTGATTLAGTTTGALNTAAAAIGGDLTISSAFRLLFGAAISKLVPGATSFSIRDNADANDNLIVTNAGAATVRAGLTVTAGGATVTAGDIVATAGRLLISSAAAKILGGATSLSLRNNADSADNVLVADAGLVTLRNALSVPTAASGTLPPTSFGTLPIKFDEQTPSSGSSITIPNSGSIPGTFRKIRIQWKLRTTSGNTSDVISIRMHADSAAHYDFQELAATASSVTTASTFTQTSARVGYAAGGTATAGFFTSGWIEIMSYADSVSTKSYTAMQYRDDSAFGMSLHTGKWETTGTPVDTITLIIAAGVFASGCVITTELYP